jgi:MFS transporter, SP family, solute carrier family 2 (myo-inositol transporter), member 13
MDISSSTETEGEYEEQYDSCLLVWLGSIAAIGGFLFGYDTSSIAGAQLYFTDTWPNITTSEIATIVSLALIGAAVGSLFSGYVSDLIGRKKVILFADVMFTMGSIIMAIADEIWILMIGRFIVGIGVGVAAQIVPLYLSEVAPTKVRGKLIATNNAMICVAQLISVLLVLLFIPDWRMMLGIAAVPSTL